LGSPRAYLFEMLEHRLPREGVAWLTETGRAIGTLADPAGSEFPTKISLASRHVPRGPLAPSAAERRQGNELLEGFDPERWSLLDAARAFLVLSRSDLTEPDGAAAIEECFRYADVGELVALYRSLALVPKSERFAWRAGEGCRSSMRSVFEAAACDTPLPFRAFDDVAWRQLVIKALFVEAPLWRVYGLDKRLDAELARMALDLADERRSAGRPVRHELWLCLGAHGGARGRAALELELRSGPPLGRRGAALALARAGELDLLRRMREAERDPLVRATMDQALRGSITAAAFQTLDPEFQG
jgi:hypothetical protein